MLAIFFSFNIFKTAGKHTIFSFHGRKLHRNVQLVVRMQKNVTIQAVRCVLFAVDMPKANHVCTSLFSDIAALSGVALSLMLGTWLAFGMSTAKSIHLTD